MGGAFATSVRNGRVARPTGVQMGSVGWPAHLRGKGLGVGCLITRWLRNGIWATEQNYAGAQIECAHGADNV